MSVQVLLVEVCQELAQRLTGQGVPLCLFPLESAS